MSWIDAFEAFSPARWPTFVFISARVGGLVTVAPGVSLQSVPRTLRGAIAVVLSLVLLPIVPSGPTVLSTGQLPVVVATEFLLGLTIGLTGAVFIHGMQVAAEVISVQMGLSIAGSFAPTSGLGFPGMGEIKSITALAAFFSLGGHLALVAGVASSFHVIAPGTALSMVEGSRMFVAVVGTLFETAVRVGGPIIVALVLANLGFAILGKAVPQLNALMMAFPVTIGLGLIVFGASLPFLGKLLAEWVDGIPTAVDAVVASFGQGGQ